MKRILSLLRAAALAVGLLLRPAAAADAAPWVEVDGMGTSTQTISLRGLSGSYDSVQLTLTLDKAPTGFTFAPSLVNDDTYTAYSIDGNSITLYVTSKNQINQGDAILLGILAGPDDFKVASASGLKLLDLDMVNMQEASYERIGIGGADVIPFADVPETEWFHDAVAYVYNTGLMNGTGDTTFSPYDTTTRGMIVTILYRYEGSPAAGTADFPDVAPGQYYTDPVAWAAANGIVNGYSDTHRFGPNDIITREQMAAILYRYAQYKGYDVSGRANLNATFTDAQQTSSYAVDALSWANYVGLITGVTTTTLQPGGSASRAQAAAILMRFCENVAQ